MKVDFKRIIGSLLIMLLLIAILPQTTLTAKASSGVDAFVTRCYKVALGREPEPAGFNDWTSKLNNGQIVGFVIAREFIFSDEYKSKNKSDDEFVKDLYMMFVDREPEQAGYDYWMSKLSSGVSREEVFAGFSNSTEFINLCVGYGITAGYYSNDYDINQINNVNLFVQRLYKTTLDRIGDPTGQEYWTKGLLEKKLTGSECAANFIKSDELVNKGLSDEEYLTVLYKGIMGRTPDETGWNYWLDALKNKTKTRDQVFEGFSKSAEFSEICNSYGIEVGKYTATDIAKKIIKSEKTYIDSVLDEWIEYDSNGKVIKYICYISDGSIAYSNEFQYDSNGKVIKFIHYKSDGSISYWDEYQYDSNGNEIKFIRYNSNGSISYWQEYQYDSYGNEIKFIHYLSNGSIFYWNEYQYDSNGNEIKSIRYNSDGSISYWDEYQYDSNGNEIKFILYNSDGSISYWDEYQYDSNGNEIKFISYNSDGSVSYWDEYQYDSNGNEIKSIRYNRFGSILFWDEYQYDSNGNEIKSIHYNGDGSISDWYEYQYDSYGNWIKEIYYINNVPHEIKTRTIIYY